MSTHQKVMFFLARYKFCVCDQFESACSRLSNFGAKCPVLPGNFVQNDFKIAVLDKLFGTKKLEFVETFYRFIAYL